MLIIKMTSMQQKCNKRTQILKNHPLSDMTFVKLGVSVNPLIFLTLYQKFFFYL